MAFCNSCGAALTPGTKFCSKCGAVVALPVPPATTTATAPVQASTGGGGALKVILIVVAILVVIGVLATATIGFIGYRFARRAAHISQEGNRVKVETPFGSAETSGDSTQAVRDMGVDMYPGAEVQKDGASTASFGNIKTVTAVLESHDPLDKVCSFYKSKYPNAMVSASEHDQCSIVSNADGNMTTIHIEPDGSTTKIQISKVNKNAGNSSN